MNNLLCLGKQVFFGGSSMAGSVLLKLGSTCSLGRQVRLKVFEGRNSLWSSSLTLPQAKESGSQVSYALTFGLMFSLFKRTNLLSALFRSLGHHWLGFWFFSWDFLLQDLRLLHLAPSIFSPHFSAWCCLPFPSSQVLMTAGLWDKWPVLPSQSFHHHEGKKASGIFTLCD